MRKAIYAKVRAFDGPWFLWDSLTVTNEYERAFFEGYLYATKEGFSHIFVFDVRDEELQETT